MQQTYTLARVRSMLGLSRGVVAGLVAAGFVTPSRGPRREYRFTFQDIVLLRAAHRLQAAAIPPRRILRSLRRLKASLPAELPLAGLRIAALGDQVVVQEGGRKWHADSGQWLMDFELQPAGETIRVLADDEPAAADDAAASFERGRRLEADDPAAAEAAYRRAIALAPGDADAYLDLGVMLCERGRCADAVELYRQALAQGADEPLLHFNLAIALEDLGRAADALAAYAECLKRAPDFADAHFNAARLHEQLGHGAQAIRHYKEYRRLQR